MKKNRLFSIAAFGFAVVTAFAGQAFTSPKAITYYRGLTCSGAVFTPTQICTKPSGTFCYSQNDGSGCVNLFKN